MFKGPYEPDRIRVDEMFDYATLKDDICDVCGCAYSAHQPVPGYPWLVKLCDGTLVRVR